MMRTLPHAPFVPLVALSLLLLAANGPLSAADNEDNTNFKRVHFSTFDEVELSGTFYHSAPAGGKKDKDAVVLLLHDFRAAKGGGSQEADWHRLAGLLQKEGYSVLSFDFRGFGNSKSVSPKFWSFPHNKSGIKVVSRKNPPASIDQKDFSAGYYLSLVNDIAAARAYLNVLNDAGDVNASNILVVGAGQGATLGALWIASECRRQKDTQSANLIAGFAPQFHFLDDPEGNDIGAAVWLTVYPSLEGRLLNGPLFNAIKTAKNSRIPTFFLYSKKDDKAATLTKKIIDDLSRGENGKKSGQKSVTEKAVFGAEHLAGSKLLSNRKTADYIIDYLNSVVENRGSRVKKDRQDQKYAFCWSLPLPTARNAQHILAKLPGEPVSRLIPLAAMGMR